ncbi:MAG TPA: pirin family protein [Solimonas sp.]
MSATDPQPNPHAARPCAAGDLQRIAARESVLGEGMKIRRALPTRERRTIGAWCFLDHFGPIGVEHGAGLRVGPHPHTGLQTFTWPIAGEILHRDSLGYQQVIRPGQVNLMTAGRGISHSEESPTDRSPTLHGAQLWIALPDSHRHIDPAFEHYADIPSLERDGYRITVMAGEALGLRSPVRLYSPLVGLELLSAKGGTLALPLQPDFEYGVLVLEGAIRFCGETAKPGELLYVPTGHHHADVHSDGASRTLLLGGTPFTDGLLMWWNFIGREKEEITQYVRDWNAGADSMGNVKGYDGARLVAPLPPWAQPQGE